MKSRSARSPEPWSVRRWRRCSPPLTIPRQISGRHSTSRWRASRMGFASERKRAAHVAHQPRRPGLSGSVMPRVGRLASRATMRRLFSSRPGRAWQHQCCSERAPRQWGGQKGPPSRSYKAMASVCVVVGAPIGLAPLGPGDKTSSSSARSVGHTTGVKACRSSHASKTAVVVPVDKRAETMTLGSRTALTFDDEHARRVAPRRLLPVPPLR